MKKSYRIVQYTHQFRPVFGGLETHVELISKHLIDHGYPTVVVTPRRKKSWPKIEFDNELRIERTFSINTRLFQGISESIGTIKTIHRNKPDIVHCHGKSWASQMTLRYFNTFQKRTGLVVTIHSDTGVPNINNRKGRFELASLLCSHRIIGVSRTLCAKLMNLGIPANKLVTLHNPVDTSLFHPISFSEKINFRRKLGIDGKKVVLYIGRLAHEKGTDILCDVWEHFYSLHKNAVLIVVGKGPLEYLVENMKDHLGHNAVLYMGYQTDVHTYMQMADVLILPSRREGLPCAVVEAASSGLPVVATMTTGSQETIDHDQTGFLVDVKTPHDIIHYLEQILSNPELQRTLGENARKKAMKLWDIDQFITSLLYVYEKSLASKIL